MTEMQNLPKLEPELEPELEPDLEKELRDALVERLQLDDVDPETIGRDTMLFGGGLELDSLDALEISVLVEETYGIVVQVAERGEAVFGTLGTLADFIRQHRGRDNPELASARQS